MAAALLYLPANRAFNSNGIGVPGAVAKLYTTGTLTPQNFYSNFALSVSLGSSITANAAGRFDPAYQDETVPFRLRIEDADGVELDDIDPYFFGTLVGTVLGTEGAVAASRAELGAMTGVAGASAILTESGREGTFVWSSANLSTQVTNDPGQGIYVPPAAATTGASGAWVRKYPGEINAKWFGATGDGTTDDTTALQSGLSYINFIVGGTLYLPEGTYKVTTYLTISPKTIVRGASRVASIITTAAAGGGGANAHENLRNGSVFVSLSAINSSTAVHVNIEDIGIACTNGSNVGAAVYERGGTFVHLHHARVSGFKYGVVFDQTELAEIELCDFEAQLTAGVWLVNGADINAGASAGFTNRISVSRSQFNQNATQYCILDDGGAVHAFIDNNYNGGVNAIRIGGTALVAIRGGEFESQSDHIIDMQLLSLSGAQSGGSFVSVSGGGYSAASGKSSIRCVAGAGSLSVADNPSFAGGGTTYPIAGVANLAQFWLGGVINLSGAAAIYDPATVATLHVDTNNRTVPYGTSLTFADILGAGFEGAVSRTDSSPFAYLDVTSKGGTGGWQGGYRLRMSYTGGALFNAYTAEANGDGVTATHKFLGPIYVNGAQILNIAGVLQAAGVPAFTGDVTSAGGSLTLTLSSATVVAKVAAQALAPASVAATGAITSSGTAGVGYATGAGAAVTQLTSKATATPAINKRCGQVTMNNAALAAGAKVSFVVTNNLLAATDVPHVAVASGGTANAYRASVTAVAAGSGFTITVENITAGSLSEAPVINFAIIDAVAA